MWKYHTILILFTVASLSNQYILQEDVANKKHLSMLESNTNEQEPKHGRFIRSPFVKLHVNVNIPTGGSSSAVGGVPIFWIVVLSIIGLVVFIIACIIACAACIECYEQLRKRCCCK